ncbi:hypothetical protein [Absidia glauca]|uniref:SMP-LTD domain-containing protein n=1 Tax=Absidia glauca TaxID=4829 RepID=A0A168NAI9_ABSGL|nr:hypothetical protein [Absidia glauca]
MIGYLLGGLTLFPFMLAIYVYLPSFTYLHHLYKRLVKPHGSTTTTSSSTEVIDEKSKTTSSPLYKIGWLRMTQGTPPTISLKKPSQRPYFAVLKYHTLYLYDSEQQLDCQQVLALQHYKVGMYPPDIQDAELFSRPYWIQLTSLIDDNDDDNDDNDDDNEGDDNDHDSGNGSDRSTNSDKSSDSSDSDNNSKDNIDGDSFKQRQQQGNTKSAIRPKSSSIYLHCHLCTEKEDWYQLLMQASGRPRVPVPMGSLQPLIQRIHGDGDQLELQWFNALLGRLFLGIHQTERFRQSVWTKVMTKVDKINARRPPFLGQIHVRAVDIGGNLPLITRPRLVGLTPQGECQLEAMIDYQGADLHLEIATVLQWSYSDRLPPLTMDIVLRVTLQSLKGKVKMLIKPPPCNRLWYGFEGLPEMTWHIAPLVWETKVGHSMVVKAIIKHLEEVFRDTMVLPHMDDLTFFDAEGLGGVYQEEGDQDETKDHSSQGADDDSDNGDSSNTNTNHTNNNTSGSGSNSIRERQPSNDTGDLQIDKKYRRRTTLPQLHSSTKSQPPLKKTSLSSVTSSPASYQHQESDAKKETKKKNRIDQLKARKKTKRTDTSADSIKSNSSSTKKKSHGKKSKQQEDMKLLSTARSFPELISAHNSYTTSITPPTVPMATKQQPSLVSSSSTSTSCTSSPPLPALSTSPNDSITSHRLSPPDPLYLSTSSSTTTTATEVSSSPPGLRPRRSFANLGQQKTSASTAVSQVNTAAGQFLGKQPL